MLLRLNKEMSLQASYTVEGSVVISICMIIIGICILLAFDIYRESIEYIDYVNVKDIDAVDTFRKIKLGESVLEGLNGD